MEKKRQNKIRRKKLKLRIKSFLKILVVVCLLGAIVIYLNTLTIKNIYIKGNETIKDVVIIEKAGIQNYPTIYKLNLRKIKEQIKEISVIDDVKIKRNIFGKLTIEVKEANILFFYKYNNKYITSSGTSIDDEEYYGYPTLINFTPDTVLTKLISGFNKINYDIIRMIGEIEYTPYKSSNGEIIDDGRFTLLMNDGNTVIIDIVNIKKLNEYNKIFASLGMDTTKGALYLDTITDDNIYFKSYETIAKEEEEAKKQQEEQEKEANESEENN